MNRRELFKGLFGGVAAGAVALVAPKALEGASETTEVEEASPIIATPALSRPPHQIRNSSYLGNASDVQFASTHRDYIWLSADTNGW